MATEAGQGEHRAYLIPGNSGDTISLTAHQHYVGVDAVAWYINKESGWFTDRIASGTLDIKIGGGAEHYQAALGTFELDEGARTAPVFDRPVVPDRNYRGGEITFNAALSSVKKDTVLAGLLKTAAGASLGIAAGMVQTATAAGPARLLSAAGGELITGVKQALQAGQRREPIFDFSGLEKTVRPKEITGPETFVLLHRGEALTPESLSVRAQGSIFLPYLGENFLDDGAWLLLRIRRTASYTGQREWYKDAEYFRQQLENLVHDFGDEIVSKDDALAQLSLSNRAAGTLFDKFTTLRTIIQNDYVLSQADASMFVGQLRMAMQLARAAIESGKVESYDVTLQAVRKALLAGEAFPEQAREHYSTESAALALARRPPDDGGADASRSRTLSAVELEPEVTITQRLPDLKAMRRTIEESFRVITPNSALLL